MAIRIPYKEIDSKTTKEGIISINSSIDLFVRTI
jgi:hypothetical protein